MMPLVALFCMKGVCTRMVDAIYTRQSVDKADSISIESQMEFCKYETRGGEFTCYSDRGFSGKNTDRPDFQRMMGDIKAGQIKRVIVYKLDRISRSILDFASMMEEFGKYGVEFVSCTEKFDTSTPMGRAMLNICIVFAQLERETIQMRVTDAYISRSKHGFFMGGKVPYGFKLEPYSIGGKKTSRYVVVPEEAEIIKLIYQMYAQPQTSLGDLMRYLANEGILTRRGKNWNRTQIGEMLKNPAYLMADLDVYEFYKSQGTNIINDPSEFIGTNGCYLYNSQDAKAHKKQSLEGQTLVIAPHEGFVPSRDWIAARKKCLNNRCFSTSTKAKNSWLVGKAKCGKCGHSLFVKYNDCSSIRYFRCGNYLNNRGCEGISCVRTHELEDFVFKAMEQRLKEFEVLSSAEEKRENPKLNELRVQEQQVNAEIDTLMDKVLQADGPLMEYINKRVAELDAKKQELLKSIRELSVVDQPTDVASIKDYLSKWDELTLEDRRNVVNLLIMMVKVTEDSIEIVWKV